MPQGSGKPTNAWLNTFDIHRFAVHAFVVSLLCKCAFMAGFLGQVSKWLLCCLQRGHRLGHGLHSTFLAWQHLRLRRRLVRSCRRMLRGMR